AGGSGAYARAHPGQAWRRRCRAGALGRPAGALVRALGADRRGRAVRRDPGPAAFASARFAREDWFPHEVLWLAKPYPDTYLQLETRGVSDPTLRASQPVQLNVYSRVLDGLPDELFTDRAVNWHGQQLGRRGLVAAAGLVVEPRGAFGSLLQS